MLAFVGILDETCPIPIFTGAASSSDVMGDDVQQLAPAKKRRVTHDEVRPMDNDAAEIIAAFNEPFDALTWVQSLQPADAHLYALKVVAEKNFNRVVELTVETHYTWRQIAVYCRSHSRGELPDFRGRNFSILGGETFRF